MINSIKKVSQKGAKKVKKKKTKQSEMGIGTTGEWRWAFAGHRPGAGDSLAIGHPLFSCVFVAQFCFLCIYLSGIFLGTSWVGFARLSLGLATKTLLEGIK